LRRAGWVACSLGCEGTQQYLQQYSGDSPTLWLWLQKHRLHDFWPWLQKLALSFSFPKENDDCASVPHEKRLVFFWILRVILEEFLTFWLWLQKSIPRSIDFMISGPGSRNLR
jgi:hypothetical protein